MSLPFFILLGLAVFAVAVTTAKVPSGRRVHAAAIPVTIVVGIVLIWGGFVATRTVVFEPRAKEVCEEENLNYYGMIYRRRGLTPKRAVCTGSSGLVQEKDFRAFTSSALPNSVLEALFMLVLIAIGATPIATVLIKRWKRYVEDPWRRT